MKNALINYIKNPKNDELYTPIEAIEPIYIYIPKGLIIWECTDYGDSMITKYFENRGYTVIRTHKNNFDFLNDKPDFNFDIIITNPPYSLKNEFLKKCYEYKKPFALLLPLTTLEGVERGKLFKQYGIELLILNKRINFMQNKKSNWFNTSWFCWKLLPDDLIFTEVK